MQTLGKNSPAFGQIFCRFRQAKILLLAKIFADWARLGNSFGQIRTYSNRFGQVQICQFAQTKSSLLYQYAKQK